ncbi:MAG: ABC transporter ATP-binding protein [Gammaproteobacteria bacterium]|nr:ABC transporter ATP-binding protein [Gammaproteobacteria bacterium]
MSLEINKLSLSIAHKTICRELDITFNPGQFWGIMGINGVGKTTLLHTLNGLRGVQKGSILLDDKNISDYTGLELAQRVGMMLQEYEYNFPSTVLEATEIGRHPFLNNWQWEDSQDKLLALKALKKVGLANLSQRQINTLSGGEKRRVNLATLLTQDPDYYLLDEPVNHLDIKSQLDMLSLLQDKFYQGHQCGVMVIHDPNLAYRFCDHMLLLFDNGQWLAGKTADIITTDNLSELYCCTVQQLSDQQHTLFIPMQN